MQIHGYKRNHRLVKIDEQDIEIDGQDPEVAQIGVDQNLKNQIRKQQIPKSCSYMRTRAEQHWPKISNIVDQETNMWLDRRDRI